MSNLDLNLSHTSGLLKRQSINLSRVAHNATSLAGLVNRTLRIGISMSGHLRRTRIKNSQQLHDGRIMTRNLRIDTTHIGQGHTLLNLNNRLTIINRVNLRNVIRNRVSNLMSTRRLITNLSRLAKGRFTRNSLRSIKYNRTTHAIGARQAESSQLKADHTSRPGQPIV